MKGKRIAKSPLVVWRVDQSFYWIRSVRRPKLWFSVVLLDGAGCVPMAIESDLTLLADRPVTPIFEEEGEQAVHSVHV